MSCFKNARLLNCYNLVASGTLHLKHENLFIPVNNNFFTEHLQKIMSETSMVTEKHNNKSHNPVWNC